MEILIRLELSSLQCVYEEDFLMPSAVMSQPNIMKSGTCPHGAPLGACPICNGMGGGMKTADHTAKPGEMSWNECAAIGAMLKAQQNAKLQRQQDAISFAQRLAAFDKFMMSVSERLANITGQISNSLPQILARPINFVINFTIGNALNIIKNIPHVVHNIVQFVSQKLIDISDKLSAIYGEIKAAISKKIGEPLNEFKKKVKSLFSIFNPQDAQNDEKKVDEAKKAFKLKTFIHNLYKRLKGDDDTELRRKGSTE